MLLISNLSILNTLTKYIPQITHPLNAPLNHPNQNIPPLPPSLLQGTKSMRDRNNRVPLICELLLNNIINHRLRLFI